MSATGATDGPGPGGTGNGSDDRSDQEYFQAIEAVFVRLRGAPFLLSPRDWRTAREWHRQGIPLDLVERTLEDVFARRRQRGEDRKISSLRYCARAVEAAWAQLRELTAPGDRSGPGAAEPLEVAPRLEALADRLPDGLRGREALAARIRALAETPDPQQVEEGLGALEAEALDAVVADLSPAHREALEADVDRGLAALADRMTREDLEEARNRLLRQKARREAGLPTLSLFASE